MVRRQGPLVRSLLGLLAIAVAGVVLARGTRAGETGTWIVVPAPAFREVLKPLEEHRRRQGLRVVRIDGPSGAGASAATRAMIHAAVRGAEGPASVLLVGAPGREGEDANVVVAAFDGTVGRMRAQPTDNPYGSLDDDRHPEVAVGRLPARTLEQARAMIEKTIAFETRSGPQPHRFDIGLVVGHPGGSSALEKRFASSFVRTEITPRFRGAHPRWRARAVVHMEESPFCVPDRSLAAATLDVLRGDQPLTVFLGHSSPRGLWSEGREFVADEDWTTWEGDAPRGVLLSCGCYTCQLAGFGGVGYGVRSVRSRGGHVAVVGAHQVSYGAMGKLAFGGLVPLLESDTPPTRLGDWYLAMKRGLGTGKIGWLSFKLYDQADGSGGRVPLETQRQEHLEMWMLLGDPALRLPLAPPRIRLEVEGEARPGAELRVRGEGPASPSGTDWTVELTAEREFGRLPADAPPLPVEEGEARDAAMTARHAQANDPVLVRRTVTSRAGRFEGTLVLPEDLPGEAVRVRATVDPEGQAETEAVWVAIQTR